VLNKEGNTNQRKRYVSRFSTLLLSTNVFCLISRNNAEKKRIELQKDLVVCSQTLVRSGIPDCPVVHWTVSGAPGWSA
jgi:hypothetical protein